MAGSLRVWLQFWKTIRSVKDRSMLLAWNSDSSKTALQFSKSLVGPIRSRIYTQTNFTGNDTVIIKWREEWSERWKDCHRSYVFFGVNRIWISEMDFITVYSDKAIFNSGHHDSSSKRQWTLVWIHQRTTIYPGYPKGFRNDTAIKFSVPTWFSWV